MDRVFFERNLKSLLVQRNFLAGLSFMLTTCLLLASFFLFFKKERIVVVPAVVEKEFWVDADSVSATYLEQYGFFLGQLLLTKSPHSADVQRAVLCRHTEPNFLAALKVKLLEEEETLKKQNASYVFYLNNIHVNPELLAVTLVGERQFLVAGQKTSIEKCGYTLYFTYTGSRLLLKGVSQVKEKNLLGVN